MRSTPSHCRARFVLAAACLILALCSLSGTRASTFDWWGFVYIPLSQEQLMRIGPTDDNWNNPNNWVVDLDTGTGKTPGGDPEDIVIIKGVPITPPRNAFGRVAELHFVGVGAVLGHESAGSIRVAHRFSVNDVRHLRRFGNITITLEETCTTRILGGCDFGSSVIENYGFISSQSNLVYIGTLNNFGRVELGSEAILGRGSPGVFNNVGRLTRVDEGSASALQLIFTNKPSGIIEVRRGTIQTDSNDALLVNEGEVQLAETNATLRVGAGRFLMEAGTRIVGPGNFVAAGGVQFALGDCSIENFVLAGGSIRGPGRVRILRTGRNDFGALDGLLDPVDGRVADTSPVFEIAPGASFTNRGVLYVSRRFENHGLLRIDAAFGVGRDLSGRPAAVINHADGIMEGRPPGWGYTGWADGVATNWGIARFRIPERGHAQIPYFNSGRIDVLEGEFLPYGYHQPGGELMVASNCYATVFGPASVTGGVLSGSGGIRFTQPTTVSATIRPGSPFGILQLVGLNSISSVTYAPDAVVEIEIGGRSPGLDYDQLQGEGGEKAPVLNGTLRVRLVGGFVPTVGDSFRIVTYPVGRFASYDFPPLPPGLGFVLNYSPSELTLQVSDGPPFKPPVLVSAGTLNGTILGLCFNEPLDAASAANVANYRLNDGAPAAGIVSATLRPDGRSVVLQLVAPVTGPFTVSAIGVLDLDLPPRASDGTVSGVLLGFNSTDIGTPGDPALPGSMCPGGSGTIDLTAGGSSVGLGADHLHFASQTVCGNFDVSARIEFRRSSRFSFAGLVAREGVEPSSRSAFVGLFPDSGANSFRGLGRMEPGTTVIDWQFFSTPAPNQGYSWVRLRRAGDRFDGFYSNDGKSWTNFATRTVSWNRQMHVGFALSAQDNTQTAEARFSGLTFTGAKDPSLPCPAAEPPMLDAAISVDGTSLTLAWSSSLPGTIVLESTDSLSPAKWLPVTAAVRDDGASKSVALPVEAAVAGKYFRLRSGP